MPKERIASIDPAGWMHPMVCWGEDEQDERGHPVVTLNKGESVGPVFAHLDAAGVDHLIRALRRAKRQTFREEAAPGVYSDGTEQAVQA